MASGLPAFDADSGADDPCGRCQEPLRPGRTPENQLRDDMNGSEEREQKQQAGNARRGPEVEACFLSGRD